jgi:hypothetical protein
MLELPEQLRRFEIMVKLSLRHPGEDAQGYSAADRANSGAQHYAVEAKLFGSKQGGVGVMQKHKAIVLT